MTRMVTLLALIGPISIQNVAQARVTNGSAVVSSMSSVPGTHLESVFSGKPFESHGVTFLKSGLTFDPPVRASKIFIETCADEFRDGIEFYVFPGYKRVYGEGGSQSISLSLTKGEVESIEVRSLAINFRLNDQVCIKNLRFKDKSGAEIPIRSETKMLASAEAGKSYDLQKSKFAASGLGAVLDHELISRRDGERWIFRVRGDGTFHVFGTSEVTRTAGRFSALGSYTIQRSSKGKIVLTLNGLRITTQESWDGWLCGQLCRQLGVQVIQVNEQISIERARGGGFMVRNRLKSAKRSLPFSNLHARSAML